MDFSSSDLELSPIKRGRKSFLTSHVLSSLDKWQISNNASMHLISAVVKALGHNVDKYVFNITIPLQRQREDNRKKYLSQRRKDVKTW